MAPHRMPNERIVITGVGAVTNLGTDADSTWDAMRAGRSGISKFEGAEFDRYAGKWSVTAMGQVKNWDPVSCGIEAREAKRLDRCTLLGMAAASEAVRSSGIDFEATPGERCGVVVGSGIGGISTIEDGMGTLVTRGPDRISPYTVPRLMVNASTGNLSIKYGLRGPAGTMRRRAPVRGTL